MAEDTKNTRRQERLTFNEDVFINGNIHTRCTDMSMGGMYLSTTHPFTEGEVITVTVPAAELTVRGIVRHSRPGRGTGVQFTFSDDTQWGKVMSLVKSLKTAPDRDTGRRRVLLLDGNAFFRETVKERLGTREFIVEDPEDGMRAVMLLNSEPVHVVLVDLGHPEGLRLIELMRSSDTHKRIPVIAFSETVNEGEIRRAFKAGANSFLPKAPASINRLHSVLTSLIKAR